MVDYRKYILDNGLTVLTHEAFDTPLATVNLLYGVGSRNEDPTLTGFAHLFEHLMFGGTERVPDFDSVVSGMGGECNAFTNCDYTNYYTTVPASGLATALALEADRMQGLSLTQHALEVQQKVVTEEYNQRYINQPYGDVWLTLRPLCYKVHPYRWATIGADIRHVAEARLDDVVAFHERWYRPDNAILAIAAPCPHSEQIAMVREAWRGIVGRGAVTATVPAEPVQTAARHTVVERDVPTSMVYLAWPMGGRASDDYRTCDLISDIMAGGSSGRLQRRLVKERGLFVEAEACITGDADPGLLLFSGKLAAGVSADEGAEALRSEALLLATEGVGDYELQKVVNKYENTYYYSQYKAADRAMALCYYTWVGDTDLVNSEPDYYREVDAERLKTTARRVFAAERENRLDYMSRQSQ